jgi:hypothetical protein
VSRPQSSRSAGESRDTAPTTHKEAVNLIERAFDATVVADSMINLVSPCGCHAWATCDKCREGILHRRGAESAGCVITLGCEGTYR